MKVNSKAVIGTLEEMKGNSADKITHGLKYYNGKEHESMIAGILDMISDAQEIITGQEKLIKILKTSLAIEGVISVSLATIVLSNMNYLKKDRKN